MEEETLEYKLIATLGRIELPNQWDHVSFSDFSINRSPNRAVPVPILSDDGTCIDYDWADPEKPDLRFPVCEYYLEKQFKSVKGQGWQRAEWELAWTLTKLRLFKKGPLWGAIYNVADLASPGIIRSNDITESLRRRPNKPPRSSLFLSFYEINDEDLEPLREFLDSMHDSYAEPFQIAIRRFNQSFDRDLPEDKAVDLFIALESLLSEGPEAIGYKIALRASHLVGCSRSEKLDIYGFLREAYSVRSRIVHGELYKKKPAAEWLRDKCYSGSTNLYEIEKIVKTVFRTLIEKVRRGEVFKADEIDNDILFS